MGGGRYDGLIETMGGPPTPGIGWAAGIERLAMLIPEPAPAPRPLAVVPMGEAAELRALAIAHDLRRAGFAVDLGYAGNLKRRLQRANRVNARAAVILGEDELKRSAAAIRDLDSGEQSEVALDGLEAHLARFR